MNQPVGALPKAVLFDMDGTLVDTEPYWIAAEFALVERHGGTWSTEHAHSLVGKALLDSAAYIQEHGGVDLPAVEIVRQLSSEVVSRVRERVPWRPGATELLGELRAEGVEVGLVTMSWRDLTTAVVAALPEGSFDVIVTGDEVTNGKPHPEPYLTAAGVLGVDPADAIAIEDSPTGIASAYAAGCRVLGVPNHVALDPPPGVVLVDTLAGLTPYVLAELLSTG